MIIRDSMIHDYGGYELDATQISNTSLYRDKIFLPYSGLLPAELTGGKASICITLQIGLTINVCLYVHKDGATQKYPVQASVDELHSLLTGFFYDFKDGIGHTRFGCGLNRYWLGIYQDAFSQWDRIVRQPSGIYSVVDQLSTDRKRRLIDRLMVETAA